MFETITSCLNAGYVFAVLQYTATLLMHFDPERQGVVRRLSLVLLPPPSYRLWAALRLGLAAAAAANWTGAIIVRGVAQMSEVSRMFPPYHTALLASSAFSWACYLALGVELDQVQPTAVPSTIYSVAKWLWLLGQLAAAVALLPEIFGQQQSLLRQFSLVVGLLISAAVVLLEAASASEAVARSKHFRDLSTLGSPSSRLDIETPSPDRSKVNAEGLQQGLLAVSEASSSSAQAGVVRGSQTALVTPTNQAKHSDLDNGVTRLGIHIYFVCAGFGTRMVRCSYFFMPPPAMFVKLVACRYGMLLMSRSPISRHCTAQPNILTCSWVTIWERWGVYCCKLCTILILTKSLAYGTHSGFLQCRRDTSHLSLAVFAPYFASISALAPCLSSELRFHFYQMMLGLRLVCAPLSG